MNKRLLLSAAFACLSASAAFATGIVATAVGTNITCNGFCDGSANGFASGGVGPYGYSWAGPASYSAATQNVTGLCAGSYTLTATDSSDMSTATYTINITQPAPISISTTGGGTYCSGTAFLLSATPSGGIPGYTYFWNPSTGLSCSTCSNPTGIAGAPITYTITVTDANGCNASTTVLVNGTPNLVVNSPTICSGASTTLSASGATMYSWSTGATTSSITVSPFSTSTYTVTGVTGGCTATAVTTVWVNSIPVVTTEPNITTCNGVVLPVNNFSSSTPAGMTTYTWNHTVPSIGLPASGITSLPSFTAINSGGGPITSTVTVTANYMGCNSSPSYFIITVNPSPVISIGSVTAASCGLCNGGATATGTGGSPPFTLTWSPGGAMGPTLTGACNGTYTITMTDVNACTSSATAVVPNAAGMTATTSATPAGCTVCNGSANVTPSGGTGPYAYDWAPGAPVGDGSASIFSLCIGTYTVTVTDAGGCTTTSVANVPGSGMVIATATSSPSPCGTACAGTVTVMESGGVPPYLYDLTGFPQQTNGNFSGVCPGTYLATVTDVNGCFGTYTVTVNSVNSSAISVTSMITNESGYSLADGSIDLTVSGVSPPFTYLWSNGATTEDLYSLSGGTYTVTITDNAGNCATLSYIINTTPGFGHITGMLYNDVNLNCVFDAGDSPLAGKYVKAISTLTYYGYTNASGYYDIYVPNGSYNVVPFDVTNLETACGSSYAVTVTSGTVSPNNDFAYSLGVVYDVCVSLWSTGIVPGFYGNYNGQIHNYGTMTAIGTFYIVKPAALFYTGSSPAASSISGDTIFWNYSIAPFANLNFILQFYTPASIPLGTVMVAYANATVTNGTDVNPACNQTAYTRIVMGSFDPNDKTVSPSGQTAAGNIPLTETQFTYLINFQNTGTAPAININVTDTISSMLDIMSFEMLDASDPYVVQFLPGNVINFKFENIMLPDSTSDEPGSHGHVLFRMDKATAPSYGEVVDNRAFIYFDFNAPVITNYATNTYALATALAGEMTGAGEVTVYPNPFSDKATFVIHDRGTDMYTFEMTDVMGKVVRSESNITEKEFNFSRDGLQNGVYFYKIIGSKGIKGIGKLVIK